MKRFGLIVLIVLLLALLAGGAAFWWMGRAGTSPIEKWIGYQLTSIAESYINPKITFDDLDYEYPGTVRLKNFRMTAPDPANAGKTIDILGAQAATLELAEIPHVGKTIKIQKIIFEQPLFQAVAAEPGKAKLVGFSDFVKQGVIKDEPDSKPDRKLSDVFQIRMFRLNDGKIVYDPRISNTEPMVLDQIYTELDILPAEGGKYNVAIGLNRKPLFKLDASSQIDLDTATLNDTAITLDAAVEEKTDNYLPPQLQKVIHEYQVKGQLGIRATGTVLLKDLKNSNVQVNALLTDANLKAGEYKIPVERFDVRSELRDGKFVVPALSLKALKGVVHGNAIVMLNKRLDSDLHIDCTDLVIDDFFVDPGTAEKPKIAGKIKADISAAVKLSALMVRLAPDSETSLHLATTAPDLLEPLPEKWGGGTIQLRQGRLVNIPVLEQLTHAITKTASIVRRRQSVPTESADVNFAFMGDQIKISEFTYAGDAVAARGSGAIALDQRLDLLMNGGPIEKLQSLLGTKIDSVINMVTPDLVTYQVKGTVDEPEISMILGSGTTQKVVGEVGEQTGKAGRKVEEGAKGVLGWLIGK